MREAPSARAAGNQEEAAGETGDRFETDNGDEDLRAGEHGNRSAADHARQVCSSGDHDTRGKEDNFRRKGRTRGFNSTASAPGAAFAAAAGGRLGSGWLSRPAGAGKLSEAAVLR